MTARIAFVTAREWGALAEDDRLAVTELERRGATVDAAIWDDDGVDWSSYDAAVLRSCWDYYHAPDAFRSWLDAADHAGTRLINPAATVRWNMDKRYLADLHAAGVATVPTEFAEPGARLADIMAARGWQEAVVKPRVSAEGHRTQRVTLRDADAHQAELDALVAGPGALVQEYVRTIAAEGEISLMFMGERCTHAVLKTTAAGDFRVQKRWGGAAQPIEPPRDLIEQGHGVMKAVALPWTYARVDACVVEGRLVLMELELIEPSLFLDFSGDAAGILADEILACVREGARLR